MHHRGTFHGRLLGKPACMLYLQLQWVHMQAGRSSCGPGSAEGPPLVVQPPWGQQGRHCAGPRVLRQVGGVGDLQCTATATLVPHAATRCCQRHVASHERLNCQWCPATYVGQRLIETSVQMCLLQGLSMQGGGHQPTTYGL